MLFTTISRKIVLLTCWSCLAAIANQTSVSAFNITLTESSPLSSNGEFIYSYDITLESGESLDPDNFHNVVLTSLAEVTGAQASSPYSVPENGFDATSANFDVVANSSSQTNFPGVIEITSTSSVVGNVDYLAFFNDGNNIIASAVGQVAGPKNSNSVPFTFSPSLGLLISASFSSMYYLKKKIKPRLPPDER
ncbi:MAG: hypothetical protein AB4206_07800 [Xenococcaceae cyanobacterium]